MRDNMVEGGPVPLKYAFTLKWNGSVVAQGTATLTTAYEIARSFVVDNYADGETIWPHVFNDVYAYFKEYAQSARWSHKVISKTGNAIVAIERIK